MAVRQIHEKEFAYKKKIKDQGVSRKKKERKKTNTKHKCTMLKKNKERERLRSNRNEYNGFCVTFVSSR